MVWQEWDIGQRECRESSRTGVRDKGGGGWWRVQEAAERGRERADGLEGLRQLNHEDGHASELDSAETVGESERGELEDSERGRGRENDGAWRKSWEIMSSWGVFRD